MKTYLDYLAEAEGRNLTESNGPDDIPADSDKLHGPHAAALNGAITTPDISNNKSFGRQYSQMRYFIALAGAHSDKDKSEEMDPQGAFSGDPLALGYTQEEDAMIQNALDMVNGGRALPMGSKHSEEHHDVNKTSPVIARGEIKLIRK
jgi:hypothetical protein